MAGKVFLVGAGPGDPGLLSIKAARLLGEADVVVLDALVSREIVAMIRPGARIVNAGKRASQHTLSQDETNALLVEEATAGNRVVRLKGGDPFVFGRGGEEAEELRKHGIDFEIVPGISSAIAGPAYAGIPVTHRACATSVTLVTGHESDDSMGIAWEALTRLNGTIVFLMGLGRLGSITAKLIEHGMSGDMPAAVIADGTRLTQKTVTGTLLTIEKSVHDAGVRPPALIVVGEVVRFRETINWFESKPLFGKRVLVTRARTQSSELTRRLEEQGAMVLEFPTISIEPPESYDSLDKAIEQLADYAWIHFTSSNGVESFFGRLLEKQRDARALHQLSIGAVGKATAAALRNFGIVPDVMPERFLSTELLPLLAADQNGIRTLVVRAEKGRDELIDELRARGGAVDLAVAYRTTSGSALDQELAALIDGQQIDYVTFTSSSTAENLFAALTETQRASLLESTVVASMGPVTSRTLRELGAAPQIEAAEASVESLTAALVQAASSLPD